MNTGRTLVALGAFVSMLGLPAALALPPTATLVPRTTFYRDETNAPLSLAISNLAPTGGTAQVDCVVGNLFTNHQAFVATSSPQVVTFPFTPSLLKCGRYPCRVTVTAGSAPVVANLSLAVAPALRRDLYRLSTWTSDHSTSDDELAFYRTLGLNQFMSHGITCAEMNRLGLEGMLYHSSWYVEGSFAPTNRPVLAAWARGAAQSLAPFPNWSAADINEEHGGMAFPDAVQRAAWFDQWAQYEADPPFYPVITNGYTRPTIHNPELCVFPPDQQPGSNGVYGITPPTFRFLDWWQNYAVWRVNALVAAEIKNVRPDLTTWTMPVTYSGQVLDAAGIWSYSRSPEVIIGTFESSYANCRAVGKPFHATLSTEYTGYGNWPVVEGPKPGITNTLLVLTPDDLIQQAWISSQIIPSDGLFYYWWQMLFHGLRGEPYYRKNPYSASNGAVALGAALKNDILPAGTMLKGTPNAQRPVALLAPESTTWFVAGKGQPWMWGVSHYYPRAWCEWLKTLQLPYDVVKDRDITPGSLAHYKAIIFPMAFYSSAFVSSELAAAGAAGTKIIVDVYAAQTNYPNMERWPQKLYHDGSVYYSPAREAVWSAMVSNTLMRLATLAEQIHPDVDAYAVGALGPLFTNVRESEGVKYVAVINNCRTNGLYTTWTKDPTFQPYGREQQATVYLKAPADSVVYEFTQSRKLKTTYRDGRHVVTISLPPHAGRLLCVYPRPFRDVLATCSAPRFVLGTPGTVSVTVRDDGRRAAPGRQLVEVSVFDPQGQLHDESGIYCVKNGKAVIPFRPALNDTPGLWRIVVRERTSGLTATNVVDVAAALPAAR